MPKDKNITKTSVKQPRELWNRVRTDALTFRTTTDAVLTEILKQHYEERDGTLKKKGET